MKKHAQSYLSAVIAVVTFIVYLPALRNEFVLWDDDSYIVGNDHIRSLNAEFFRWAFTDMSVDYWQPLSWITHALVYAIWGLNPLGHHLTNVLIHAANTFIVVYLIIKLLNSMNGIEAQPVPPARLDGRKVLITGAVAGMLFGIHPVHVESVAWVTERKDLLCALFYLLSISSYISYVGSIHTGESLDGVGTRLLNKWYLWTIALFVFALASKPMAVTLPLVLVLLDWFPFRRYRSQKSIIPVSIDKLPFIMLSLASSIVTLTQQKGHGNIISLQDVPITSRLVSAAQALMTYLEKVVIPVNLLPFYPDPQGTLFSSSWWFVGIVLVCGFTAASVNRLRKQPVWFAVWCFFIISLLPVLGLVRVGSQLVADRFLYLPSLGPFLLIGLFTAGVWTKADTLQHDMAIKRIAATLAICVLIWLSYLTVMQIAVWKNTITLWSHVIENVPNQVPIAYNNRGIAFSAQREPERALLDLTTAITLNPNDAKIYITRSTVFAEMGQLEQALDDYTRAIILAPEIPDYYVNRGILLKNSRQFERALEDFDTAIRLNPALYSAYNNRGLTLKDMGMFTQALEDYNRAINLNPVHADAYNNRGVLYSELGQYDRSLMDYSQAISLNPALYSAHNNRGLAFRMVKKYDHALQDFNAAITLDPKPYIAYLNRSMTHQIMGKLEKALDDITAALSMNPDIVNAYNVRGDLYQKTGMPELARKDYQTACALGSKAGCEALRSLAVSQPGNMR